VKPSRLLFRLIRKALIPNLPPSWRLPVLYWNFSCFSSAEPELLHLDLLTEKRTTAIDVGANLGLYSYKFSKIFENVHSFEINPQHSKDLIAYGAENVELHQVGLSNRNGEAVLFTPIHPSGMRLESWASLEPGNCPGASRVEESRVQVKRLDEFDFQKCSFLKIDVEGHEIEVLEGGIQTIARTLPRVLIEVRAENLALVDRLLGEIGLRRMDVHHLIGCQGAEGNYFYLP